MHQEDKAWIEYKEKFSEIYDKANYSSSSSLRSAIMRASHRLVEKSYGEESHFGRVLEIGAGTGEHVSFVRHRFDEYTLTDMDKNMLDVAGKKLAGRHEGKLRFSTQTGSSLTYADNTFDRLIASHVLEHIYQPHLAVKEWRRVLKPGGVLSILIPTDPGFAWRMARHIGPRRYAISLGVAYDYVMAREHVNSSNNLIAILRHYFPDAKEAWWPLPIPSIDVNLFFAFHATVSKQEAVQ